MVKKKDEKKGKSGFTWAQISAYSILGKTGEKVGAEIGSFSDVKTPETGHPKRATIRKIGPADRRRAVFGVGLPVSSRAVAGFPFSAPP